jgi:hypothetical protein
VGWALKQVGHGRIKIFIYHFEDIFRRIHSARIWFPYLIVSS